MKKDTVKILRISVLLALIFSVLISCVQFEASCTELKENVLRLHIIANSDSEADQNLKLKVRDAILEFGCDEFENTDNLYDAVNVAENSLEEFKSIAEKVIRDNGYNYEVSVGVDKVFFDTRVYDDFTLPAGEYEALCVKIGQARGKNWWCVMYPAVCIPAASANLNEAVSEPTAEIAHNPQKYIIRFKTVEIFEEIKNFFKKSK